ncbi:hypothetical protein Fot_55238 [Forsythia ovata]|uniref:Uncharacterized protein n=1 Tax=Forsythia ovata TaxID=205694 RepID=A0ABD1P0N4_9LAMI
MQNAMTNRPRINHHKRNHIIVSIFGANRVSSSSRGTEIQYQSCSTNPFVKAVFTLSKLKEEHANSAPFSLQIQHVEDTCNDQQRETKQPRIRRALETESVKLRAYFKINNSSGTGFEDITMKA